MIFTQPTGMPIMNKVTDLAGRTKLLVGASVLCLSAGIAMPVNATEPASIQLAQVPGSFCYTPVLSCEILGRWVPGTPCHCFLPYGGSANGIVI